MNPAIATCVPHDPAPRPPTFAVPALACDCHAHVCGPAERFPYADNRIYTPPDASPRDFRHMLDALGVERAVLVQPSVYGEDNRAMLEAIAGDPRRLRGVAVVPFDIGDGELAGLHEAGVRGVRCNIVDVRNGKGQLPLERLVPMAERISRFGWHLEFLMHVNEFPDLDRQLRDFPVPMVFGHLGYVPTQHGIDSSGFQALLRLMAAGRTWVKLTAPYRLTGSALPYEDTDSFARQLVATAPHRLVWGSDWPHVIIKTSMPNDGDLFDLLARWVADPETRRRILVDNPAALYDFPLAG